MPCEIATRAIGREDVKDWQPGDIIHVAEVGVNWGDVATNGLFHILTVVDKGPEEMSEFIEAMGVESEFSYRRVWRVDLGALPVGVRVALASSVASVTFEQLRVVTRDPLTMETMGA